MSLRPKSEIVLRALNKGLPVKLGGYWCRLSEDGYYLLMRLTLLDRDNEPVSCTYNIADIDFTTFMKWCQEISEEDIMGLVANSVLQDISK